MKLKTKFRILTISISIIDFFIIVLFLFNQQKLVDVSSKAFDGINSTESSAYLVGLLYEIREAELAFAASTETEHPDSITHLKSTIEMNIKVFDIVFENWDTHASIKSRVTLALNKYLESVHKTIQKAKDSGEITAVNNALNKSMADFNRLINRINHSSTALKGVLMEERHQAKLQVELGYYVVAGLVLLTLSFLIVLNMVLKNKILLPIFRTKEIAEQITLGNLDIYCEVKTGDEVGELANSFNIMAENLQSSTNIIKEKERELINTNNFINNIINSMPSIIVGLDNERKVTHWNSFVEKQTNLNFKQVKGKIVSEVLPFLKNHLNDIKLAIKKKNKIRINRMTIVEKNGQQYLDMMIYPLISNHIEGVILRGDNVTDQVRLEESLRESEQKYRELNQELEQKVKERTADLDTTNNELSDFAHIVSHDLKAPLRAVGQLADWIVDDYSKKIDDEGKKMFGLLTGRVQRMYNLIEGILHYSRIGRLKEKREIIQTDELIRETTEALAPPQNICIEIEDNLPKIKADRTSITQVFQNLIGNALKYIDKPEGKIEIGCKRKGDFWQFHVSDNGPGIEQEYYEKIFKIFQTLQPRDQHESTGVGLALVKKIVEQYEGKVWLESEVGKGSTFYFTILKE